jgi:hypothetical protein
MGRISRYVGVLLSGALCLPAPLQATETIAYTYDALGRVTGVSSTGTINAGQTVSTTFDPAGNRTNYTVTGAAAAPTFSINDATATEGGSLVFTVTRSNSTGTATVSFTTVSGTAVSPGDFTAQSNTLTFNPGQLTKTITVTTANNTVIEPTEDMTVTLSSPSTGWFLGDASGTGTILDDDVATISVANTSPSVTEGGNLAFTITRSGITSNAVSASYATSNGTATAGSDYTATSGTVNFASGVTSQTVNVPTTNDTTPESSETVNLTLSSPSAGAAIGTATRAGTILDNDTSTISIGDATVTEGGTLSFTVTRSAPTTGTVGASYATVSDTATSPSDFTAKTGTVSFASGVTSQTITVTTIDDASVESAETMNVNLSSPTGGAAIGTSPGTGTINDNDTGLPEFSIADASGTEGDTIIFAITRSGNTSNAVSIEVTSASGTATKGSDFSGFAGTIGFSAGQTTANAGYTLLNNSTHESTETFTVTISPTVAGTATIVNGTATGTIFDDE